MSKIAFLFPGQGSQKPGMVRELFEILDEAEQARLEAAFPGISQAVRSDDKADTDAMAAQLVYLSGLLSARACVEAGILPDVLAGFSLGEITALGFSGVLNQADADTILSVRTKAMYQASTQTDGAMAAVNGLDAQPIEDLIRGYEGVYAVNYNSPQQTVISGLREPVTKAVATLKAAGAKVMLLNVRGAFHTPYMESASQALEEVLTGINFESFRTPVLSNIDAREYPIEEAAIRDRIIRQVVSPVRFTAMVEAMYRDGVRIFIETGFGRTLQGLVTRILPEADLLTGGVSDRKSLEEIIEKIKEKTNV